MCSISINDGTISINSSSTFVCSNGVMSGGTYAFGVTESGESINDWKCNTNGEIDVAAGNHAIGGKKLSINADVQDEDVVLNLDTQDSTCSVTGDHAYVSMSDDTTNTYALIKGNDAGVFLENSKFNTVCIVGENAEYYSDAESGGNVLAMFAENNKAYISGDYNMLLSANNSLINIDEYAERTMISGTNNSDTESFTDVVNDKGSMTFYYGGTGNVELNSMGYGLLANISNNESAQENYMGRFSAIFAGERYIDDDAQKVYDYKDYLYQYGWTDDHIGAIFDGTNNQEYYEEFFQSKFL